MACVNIGIGQGMSLKQPLPAHPVSCFWTPEAVVEVEAEGKWESKAKQIGGFISRTVHMSIVVIIRLRSN